MSIETYASDAFQAPSGAAWKRKGPISTEEISLFVHSRLFQMPSHAAPDGA